MSSSRLGPLVTSTCDFCLCVKGVRCNRKHSMEDILRKNHLSTGSNHLCHHFRTQQIWNTNLESEKWRFAVDPLILHTAIVIENVIISLIGYCIWYCHLSDVAWWFLPCHSSKTRCQPWGQHHKAELARHGVAWCSMPRPQVIKPRMCIGNPTSVHRKLEKTIIIEDVVAHILFQKKDFSETHTGPSTHQRG